MEIDRIAKVGFITEDEIDTQCQLLFDTAPIPFKPRRNNILDEKIEYLINVHNIRIPICQIKDNLYLIGTNRLNCDLKNDKVNVRVGGGTDLF